MTEQPTPRTEALAAALLDCIALMPPDRVRLLRSQTKATLDSLNATRPAAAQARTEALDDRGIERMARQHFESRRHFFEPPDGDVCTECGEGPEQDFIRVTMHFTDGDA